MQRWRERSAEFMAELGVPARATWRHDRRLVKSQKPLPSVNLEKAPTGVTCGADFRSCRDFATMAL